MAMTMILLPILLMLGSHQTPSTAELRAAFAREYKATSLAPEPDSPAWRRLWDAADAYVLRALNHGAGVADVQRLLRDLPGYMEPHAGDAKQIGGIVFYSVLASDVPSYWVFPPAEQDSGFVVGVYNLELYPPGRVSVYRRRGDAWTIAAKIDGEHPIRPYVLTSEGHVSALATVQTFLGADHSTGILDVWRWDQGSLVRLGGTLDDLLDPHVSASGSALIIDYDFSMACACQGFLEGSRGKRRVTVQSTASGADVSDASLTPWLEVLNEYFCRMEHRKPIADLLSVPADATLAKLTCGRVVEHGGDVQSGRAFAVVKDNEEAGVFRLEFTRNAGKWLIAGWSHTK